MAVLILYFHKLNPFSPKKTSAEKRGTWRLWGMVAIGCIPAAAIGLTLDHLSLIHISMCIRDSAKVDLS